MRSKWDAILRYMWITPIIISLLMLGLAWLTTGYRPLRAIIGQAIASQAMELSEVSYDTGAVPLAERALRLDDNLLKAHYLLGLYSYTEKEDHATGLAHFEKAAALASTNCEVRFYLAQGLEKTGNLQRADQEYAAAESLCPLNQDLTESFIYAYARLKDVPRLFATLYKYACNTTEIDKKFAAIQKLNGVIREGTGTIRLTPGRPLGFGHQASAAADDQGVIHLLALDKNYPNLLIYARSTNGGKTWSGEEALYCGETLGGTLTIDSAKTIHVAFGVRTNELFYTNSLSGFKEIVPVANQGDGVQIAAGRGSIAHLVWFDPKFNLVYATLDIGSHSVTERFILAQNATGAAIAIDANDGVYVSYNDAYPYPDPRSQVSMAKIVDDKGASTIKISAEKGWAGASDLAVGTDGTLHIIYITGEKDQTPWLNYVRISSGMLPDAPITLSTEAMAPYIPSQHSRSIAFAGNTGPALAFSARGELAVVWRASTVESSPVILRQMISNSWGDSILLGDLMSAEYTSAPSLVTYAESTAGSGPIWVLWYNAEGLHLVPVGW